MYIKMGSIVAPKIKIVIVKFKILKYILIRAKLPLYTYKAILGGLEMTVSYYSKFT